MDKLKGDLAEMERVSKQQKDELAVVKNEWVFDIFWLERYADHKDDSNCRIN